MIVYKNGDLLKSDCDYICHQVNCKGVMGSGIARQIRDAYPSVYQDYLNYCSKKKPEDLFGDILFTYASEVKDVINMFAELDYLPRGICHTDYEKFRGCCKKIKNVIKLLKSEMAAGTNIKIGFPDHIGCGLAGGDWNIVKRIIEEEFAGDEWNVEIWKLN